MPIKNSVLKSMLNAISMITVPVGALDVTVRPFDYWGYVIFAVGFGIQIAKYYLAEKEK